MNKADNQIIALPFLEFLRRIQREAGLLGNGARSLEWIHQRLQHSKSIREKSVLGDQVIWILSEISPQLLSTSWPKKFYRLSLGNRFSAKLQSLPNDSNHLDWVPGTVGCLLVERGNSNGFVRKLRFARGYDRTFDSGENLGPIARDTVEDVSKLVSKLCSIDLQGGDTGTQWGFEGTSDKTKEIEGTSLGFAVALGSISVLIDRDVSQVFVSGALDHAGRSLAIKQAVHKANAALREWPDLKRIVLPIANREDFDGKFDKRIVFVSDLEELIEVCFGVLPNVITDNRPKDVKLHEIQRLCQRERQPAQGYKAARRFIKQCPGRNSIYERFQAGWYLVDCLIHLGRLDEASKVLSTVERQSRSLLKKRRIRPVDYLRVRMNRSRIHWGRFNYAASIRSLTKLIKEMHELMGLREEEARLYGTLGQVFTHAGQFAEAEQALENARLLMRDNPDEISREYMLLGDLYRRMGDFGKANRTLSKAASLNRCAPTKGIRFQNQTYIHLAKARLARAQKQWKQVRREAHNGLSLKPHYHPRCLLERELGVALWQIGDQTTSADLLSKTVASDDPCSYDALAKIIGNTATLELIILLSANKPYRAAKIAQDVSKEMQGYRPMATFGKRNFQMISKNVRKIEASEETDQAASELAKETSILLSLIAW